MKFLKIFEVWVEIGKVESITIDKDNKVVVGLVSSHRIKSEPFTNISVAKQERDYLIGVIENIDLCLKCQKDDKQSDK